ncbi:MAG TPA: PepSY domain-containing protein, partial [Anaeromyxobacteraceae bacterium]|nr:PepSY domain-containing protein [Anaeromyxobacteraceae bacterium]
TASGLAAIALWALGDRVRARRAPRSPCIPSPSTSGSLRSPYAQDRRSRGTPASAGLRLRMLAWHRRLGWLGGLALLALVATGVPLNHVGPLRARFLPQPRVERAPTPADVRAAIAVALAALPATAADRIEPPRAPDAPLRVRFRGGARVHVDAVERRVLAIEHAAHPLVVLYPLHSGRVAGPAGPPAVALAGALGLAIVATGAAHHLRKRARPRASPQGSGRRARVAQSRDGAILLDSAGGSPSPSPRRSPP